MNFLETHRWELIAFAAAALVVAGGIFLWWRHRPRDPEEIERHRRFHLSRVGRIIEGEVLEILDSSPSANSETALKKLLGAGLLAPASAANGPRKLVFYSYSISGVTYQTAQDITGLEERAVLDRVAAGQVASVKYDPANPGNSILVAEDWSGLI